MPTEPTTSENIDSVGNQGEFHSKVPRSQPMTTGGHAPGVKVGNDAVPEFSAKPVPQGTAPKDRTFEPNAYSDVSAQEVDTSKAQEDFQSADIISGQTSKSDVRKELGVGAGDSNPAPGATSKDVHQGLGHPGSGQSSKELHGDGSYPGKRERNGLAGIGGDPADTYKARGWDVDHPKGIQS